MEAKIIQENENPLFNRKEIIIEIQAETTPNKADAEKLLAEKFSTQTENIAIQDIKGKFGSKEFKITGKIYKIKEDKEKTEQKQKTKEGEGEQKESAPAADKAEDASSSEGGKPTGSTPEQEADSETNKSASDSEPKE